MRPVRLQIAIVTAQRTSIPPQSVEVAPSERVVAIVQRLLAKFGSDSWPGEWNLLHEGVRLPLDGTIGTLVPEGTAVVRLTLSSESCDLPAQAPEPDPEDSGIDLAFEEEFDDEQEGETADDRDDDIERDAEAPAAQPAAAAPQPPVGAAASGPPATTPPTAARFAAAPAAAAPAAADARRLLGEQAQKSEALPSSRSEPGGVTERRAAAYHATVRYYCRMNPQRVYPLLVMLGKDMVARLRKGDLEPAGDAPRGAPAQANEPLVEVEPVLPGCACWPAKQTTRLGGGDVALRFHVVPQVLGTIAGAAIVVRQDRHVLATVALEPRVVQRKSAVLFGALTLLSPLATALLRHANVQLDARAGGGFDVAVALVRMLVQIPPGILLAVLAAITGVLFWMSRPRATEVFWGAVTPDDWLADIAARQGEDAERAAADLVALLSAHPEHQPAWLHWAQWRFEEGEYETALAAYEKAFGLGAARSHDYVRAALAASRLGRTRQALDILRGAERALPVAAINGVVFFNMGCYHARLGQLDEVVPCLRRAVGAGYRKVESFLEDDDLAAVRGRPDFEKLVAELRDSASG